AMLASIFEEAGYEPTVAVGGVRVDTGTNAHAGAGTWFITESDESDGSFLHLSPTIAVVNNIENDHISSDAELPQLLEQFSIFVNKVPASGRAIVGTDNKASALVGKGALSPVTTFATRAEADLTIGELSFAELASRFVVYERGVALGELRLSVPGEINVQNALGALGAARAAGVPFDAIARALANFHGVRRRFEIVGRGAITVVDDYAHHPTAIAQTIAAARGYAHGPLVVAFQPHRYTRTAYLKDDFARALQGADRVFLTPIYAASEAPLPGISERSIGEPLAASGTVVDYVGDVDELVERIRHEAPDGALVLMLGAGSISAVAHRLGERVAAGDGVRVSSAG
ncbi:MAG TPA: cyanophycin synthetase, partial [Candidatus Acidoferrum sp.]|nr:cyanophycin synthetase [Candidatus Acidoferrum sp.]